MVFAVLTADGHTHTHDILLFLLMIMKERKKREKKRNKAMHLERWRNKKKIKKIPRGWFGVWAAGRDEQKKQRREMRSSALPVRI